MLMTGLMFSSCKKENKVAEETPVINTFEDFQEWAGDKLVYSEELSDEEYDCYLYYAAGKDVEPTIIAQAKKSADKGLPEKIICSNYLHIMGNVLTCYDDGTGCNRMGNGAIEICDWSIIFF